MSLDAYDNPGDLYLTRSDEVNLYRPLFTGDVFDNVPIPGVQGEGLAMILAHPCSFRIGAGELTDRVLVARVGETQKQGPNAWTRGLFDRMPLPELHGEGLWAGYFSEIGRAAVADLLATYRRACLSEIGINMLQQRLTFHLTRAEIPTQQFNQAFSHTLVEADLLEDWTDTLTGGGWSQAGAVAAFEPFIRSGQPTLQDNLLDPQRRSAVRAACKREARRILDDGNPTT